MSISFDNNLPQLFKVFFTKYITYYFQSKCFNILLNFLLEITLLYVFTNFSAVNSTPWYYGNWPTLGIFNS